jgi:hypothetical protein
MQITKAFKPSRKETQPSSPDADKPFWWLVLMFICSFLYLIPEAVFNAELISVAGGKISTEDDLKSVELFGRTISGIGVTLLLADLLLTSRLLTSRLKTAFFFILIASIAWPTVFFGQKWLVDHFIVEPSTAEQRQHAYFSHMLRNALIEKSVKIEGVEFQPGKEHSPEEQTFLSVFGGLVYADDALIKGLGNKKREIVEQFVLDNTMTRFEQYYSEYKDFRSSLRLQYKEYINASSQYNDVIAGTEKRADQYWLDVQNEISEGWEKYQNAKTSFNASVEARAQEISPKIFEYFEREQKCYSYKDNRQKSCLDRVNKGYDTIIKKYDMPYIPANDWLITRKVSSGDILSKTYKDGTIYISDVVSSIATIFSGKDVYETVYTDDVNHNKNVLFNKMVPIFIQESGGYPLEIGSISTFKNNDVTANNVRNNLRIRGLILGDVWNINQRAEFDSAVKQLVKKQADKEWNQAANASGQNLAPNLSWVQFQKDEFNQSKIAEQMGDMYVNPMMADWNNAQFRQYVIDVNVARKTDELVRIIEAQRAEFEDGGEFEQIGKSAIRAIIIPPISMFISLLLVLLTVLKLPIKMIQLVQSNKNSKAKSKQFYAPTVTVVLIVIIFSLPMTTTGNQFTHSSSAVNYFFDQMEKGDSPLISYSLRWLLTTQPHVLPYGVMINQKLNVLEGFQAISAPIDKLDLLVFEKARHSDTDNKTHSAHYPLTIKTNIQGAKISIMNIKPKYKDGIMLPAGPYDIKVSATGNEAVRKWIHLKKGSNSFVINL